MTSAVDAIAGREMPLRPIAADAFLFVGVPLLMLTGYVLPASLQREFVLWYSDPRFVSVYASHFVHFRWHHLVTNLVGYLLVLSVAYVIARLSGDTSPFRVAFFGLLVGLPVGLSLLNVAWPRPEARVGYGASGLVMGAVGLLPVLLFRYFERRSTAGATADDAPLLFLAGLTVVSVVAPIEPVGYAVGAVALLGAAAYARDSRVSVTAIARLQAPAPEVALIVLVLVVGYPFVAFPNDPTTAGGTLNLYTHLLGYALAFIAAYLTPGIGTDRPTGVPGWVRS